MPSPNQTERELLEDLRAGRKDAFEEIFKRYWQQLYHTAFNKLQSHAEAEEIVQNIFSGLWEKRKTILIDKLDWYLHTSVRNRVINLIRHKITERKYCDFYMGFMPNASEVTENKVLYNDLSDAVEVAMKNLPQKSRIVFKLNRMEGRSIPEIANRLKLSEKAIEYHLTKSLKAMRVQLRDVILVSAFLLFHL
jgi:RNA polymerase sigma-70 factor (ECF subfamily)